MQTTRIVGRFGGDASRQRAEALQRKLQKANPRNVYMVEEPTFIEGYGYPRFENGITIDYFVVAY